MRLATAVLFALAVRAVVAQQPAFNGPQRSDPYAPQSQQPPVPSLSLANSRSRAECSIAGRG